MTGSHPQADITSGFRRSLPTFARFVPSPMKPAVTHSVPAVSCAITSRKVLSGTGLA